MNKNTKLILIIVGVVAGGYLLWSLWKNHQAQGSANGVATGTNLNSVAPELVGGSAGPNVGPAVSLPVNITLTEQAAPNSSMPDQDGNRQHGGGRNHHHHLRGPQPQWFGPVPGSKSPSQLGLAEKA